MALEKELETYNAHRDELLRDEGKWVVIHGDRIAGIGKTYEEAIEAGYKEFGLNLFLVKQILVVEPVHHVARGIPMIRHQEDQLKESEE